MRDNEGQRRTTTPGDWGVGSLGIGVGAEQVGSGKTRVKWAIRCWALEWNGVLGPAVRQGTLGTLLAGVVGF